VGGGVEPYPVVATKKKKESLESKGKKLITFLDVQRQSMFKM